MNPFRWSFSAQTTAALVVGLSLGLTLGPRVSFLGIVATAILAVIKAFATPLLFFAIIDAILNAQFKGRGVVWMLAIAAFNGALAVGIALILLNVFRPGAHLPMTDPGAAQAAGKAFDWSQALLTQLPDSVVGPFATNTVPAVIVLALFAGFGIVALERRPDGLEPDVFASVRRTVALLLRLNLKILGWIVALSPIAILAAVAKAVGDKGLAILPGLGAYLATCLGGMALQVGLVYQAWVRWIGGIGLRRFWREAREPIGYSFGVNSSLATLPLSLRAMDRLGVSPASARLSACVGTNLNNDGILLYEVAAALFLAQAYGIDLNVWQQLGLAAICVLATVGVAGVPEAGIIALTLVLSTAGLPAEALPILLTVDWLVARCRSMVNVCSDLTVGIGIDAMLRRRGP